MSGHYNTYLCRQEKSSANRQDLGRILEIFSRAIGGKMNESEIKEFKKMVRFFGDIDGVRLDYSISTDANHVVRCIRYSEDMWERVHFIGDKSFAVGSKIASSATEQKLWPVLLGLCVWSFLVAAIANEVVRNGF